MSNYWKRRNEEMKHIQSMFKTDAQYNKAVRDLYKRSLHEIEKEISAELSRYAGREQLSIDDARVKVLKMDVETFQSKAKQYVKERNFTERANEELRAYNVKMRMNRLRMLQENIRLETIALADAEDKLLHSRLDQEAWTEIVRQAGILGESVPTGVMMNRKVKAIINADFKGTQFSNRIWANQTELQHELERVIERTLIQGKHPREGTRDLRRLVRDSVENKRHAAERIAITESARVQTGAQKIAYEEFEIDMVEWVAEPDACDQCAVMDGVVFARDQMDSGSTTIPAHPHCRCSYAAIVDRNAWERDLRKRGL